MGVAEHGLTGRDDGEFLSDNDDATIGRVLSRREVLALLGVASLATAALAAGCWAMATDRRLRPAGPPPRRQRPGRRPLRQTQLRNRRSRRPARPRAWSSRR